MMREQILEARQAVTALREPLEDELGQRPHTPAEADRLAALQKAEWFLQAAYDAVPGSSG